MTMNTYARAMVLLGLLASAGCAADTPDEPVQAMHDMLTTAVADVDAAAWQALASRRIFFGHQSVGRDIVSGMARVLADHPEIGVRVVGAEDPAEVEGPAFIEARIGRNREPDSKTDAFVEVLASGFGTEGDNAVAMYKYCYVDVQPGTDPVELFENYAASIEAVRATYPQLTIVHFTLPLRTADTGLKERLKTLAGLPTQTRLNATRNHYNALLRERYAGVDPIFDLALLESTRPDGSRAFSRYRGENVYMLAPEWTTDGGHLNDAGQYRIAERLLVFLAQLGEVDEAGDAATGDVANAQRAAR